jgi:hypothetical protein
MYPMSAGFYEMSGGLYEMIGSLHEMSTDLYKTQERISISPYMISRPGGIAASEESGVLGSVNC